MSPSEDLLLKVIKQVRMIEPRLTLLHLQVLCFISVRRGASVGEISHELGEPQSSVSRYLADMAMLSTEPRKRKLALIDIRSDMDDRRIRKVCLSERGHKLINSLNANLCGK